MKKFLTYRTATIAGWIGLALLTASWFLPLYSWQERAATMLGIVLIMVDIAATYHAKGRIKGHADARAIITEEFDKRIAEAKLTRVPIKQDFGPTDVTFNGAPVRHIGHNPLEAEHRQYLAADKVDEPTEWGTDFWGDIETEPSEAQAREVVRRSSGTKLYSRQPGREWVKVERFPGYSMLNEHHGQETA